ncbi:LOW QUALITY PROTEIN: putative BTB/POZ domain-containing protein At2g05330 [Eutrema salsugineum]|uniref:LOW QUALITY PROTEIN: putative BTB/POZ domain-containing protein At2g05330 n=1 Tax=Eutrema salsugineum TaxID=72664 RepID=UPI000CED4300|nr:LOW QUALITY PROTEIN: putative BTB/POZ domain-containing protein At2g05330 [Eutrema salsugineum]
MATQSNKERFWGDLQKPRKSNGKLTYGSRQGTVMRGSRSEVLKKMLESDEVKTLSNQVETVILSEMKQEELVAFVEFMYSDGSLLSEKVKQHVRSLYLVADQYEILHLRDLCRDELISSLNSLNALELLELAQTPFDKVLNDAAFNFIKMNLSTIVSSDEFKLFVTNNPKLAVDIMNASLSRVSINEPSKTRIENRVVVQANVDEEVVHVNENFNVDEEVVHVNDNVNVDEEVAVRKSTRPRKPNRKYFDY